MAKSYGKTLLKIVHAVNEYRHARLLQGEPSGHADTDIPSGDVLVVYRPCGFAKLRRYPCFRPVLATEFLEVFRK